MSAITLTVMVVGLTPTSLAVSVVVLQTSDVVSVGYVVLVVSPPSPIFLPLLHADSDQHDDEQNSDPAEAPQGSPSFARGPPI